MSNTVTARKVRERRLAAELSVAEAAKAAGISRMTLYAIESGERAPHMATLRRLSRALHTSPAYLLSDAA